MAEITLQDSGYISPTNTGTRAASANMANSGNAITLKSIDFKPHAKGNLDVSPILGVYGNATNISTGAVINLASIENIDFNITGILNMNNASERSLVVPLVQLARTKWYKLMYYTSTGTDQDKQLIYQLCDDTFTAGEVTAFGLSAAYKHLHVMVEDVQFMHTATNLIKYTIKGWVTKKETSTL